MTSIQPLVNLDPRVTLIERDGYDWGSYDVVEAMGLLADVPRLEFDAGGAFVPFYYASMNCKLTYGSVHPTLQYISHLPSSVNGEQFISQLLRSVPERQWLFRYGRVPLNYLMSDHVWQVRVPVSLTFRSSK